MTSIDDILTERAKTHGSYPHQASLSQALKSYIEIDDLVLRETAHMICLKLARASEGNELEIDHWRDIAGYATLAVRYLEGNKFSKGEEPFGFTGARDGRDVGDIIESLIMTGQI